MMLVAFNLNAVTKNQITCTGSTTVLPIAQATAGVFMNSHPDINISIRGGGSGVGALLYKMELQISVIPVVQ